MTKALIIVESPAKARTISKFLVSGYTVESWIGHIRDLPSSAAEIPAKYKKEPWSRLGVDVVNDFKPLYVVPHGKKKQVDKLKRHLREASELLLATDEDREGEAIAWHLVEVLDPKCPVRRLVFHEITRSAIEHAIADPRGVDQNLVNAQEARRILDRLVGYEVSPVLWRKLRPKLSAGRVQSVATRLVVAREEARMRFVAAGFAGLEAELAGERYLGIGSFRCVEALSLHWAQLGKHPDGRGRVHRSTRASKNCAGCPHPRTPQAALLPVCLCCPFEIVPPPVIQQFPRVSLITYSSWTGPDVS